MNNIPAAVAPETLAAIQGMYPGTVQAVSYTVGILTNMSAGEHTVQVIFKNAAGETAVLYEFTYTIV